MEPQNFELHRGNYKKVTFPVVDQAGEAVDLTGTTVLWSFAKYPGGEPVVSKTSEDGGVVLVGGGSGGECEVVLNSSDTSEIEPGLYYHEALLKDASDNPTTIMIGQLEIKASQHS